MNSQIETVDQIISNFGWGLLVLIVLGVGVRLGWKHRDGIRKWFGSLFGSKNRSSSKSRS
jgi:hypothetical protein